MPTTVASTNFSAGSVIKVLRANHIKFFEFYHGRGEGKEWGSGRVTRVLF